MNPKKQSRRKPSANKLEPIDWREFANDAVLNGNMSTLYRRPPTEDPSAYASPEAMIEIEKRVIRPVHSELPGVLPASGQPQRPTVGSTPTVGSVPAEEDSPAVSPEPAVDLAPTVGTVPVEGASPRVGMEPPVGLRPTDRRSGSEDNPTTTLGSRPTGPAIPTVGTVPSEAASLPPVGLTPTERRPEPEENSPTAGSKPTAPLIPTVGTEPTQAPNRSTAGPLPTEGFIPTVGSKKNKKIKPIRTVQDALTLAGQVLYRAMLGSPDAASTSCTKGYRQLAADTHLDKDTVRDLIVEFKNKGIVRETATYDPDTRLSKTYEVLSNQAVLQAWRESGILFVTAGRQRPLFCSAVGEPITFKPTVGLKPVAKP